MRLWKEYRFAVMSIFPVFGTDIRLDGLKFHL